MKENIMKSGSTFAALAMLVALVAVPKSAFAPTGAVASIPAQGATVKGPRVVMLTFSEALLPLAASAVAYGHL
jgi:methionine-rich copper-binding protein CopC